MADGCIRLYIYDELAGAKSGVYDCAHAGDLPERVLHVGGADTAAGARADAQRPADPVAAGVEAASAAQLAAAVRRPLGDQHHRRHGRDRHRARPLPHPRPRTTGMYLSLIHI